MKIVENGFTLPESAVAIGNFDGVHLGHRFLLKKLFASSAPSLVFTFSPHPYAVLHDAPFPVLTTLTEKADLLDELGVSYLYAAHCDRAMLSMPPEQFVKEKLVDDLHASLVVMGSDFRFGAGGTGNADTMKVLGEKYSFRTVCVDKLTVQDTEVSSTLIRKLLTKGDVYAAGQLLGRPYSLSGVVSAGRHKGADLGFPTVNLPLSSEKVVPAFGVYQTEIQIENKRFPSLSFLGTSPTYRTQTPILETHIPHFNENLYGQYIRVHFIRFLRETVRFSSEDQLKEQIGKDLRSVSHFGGHHA